MKRKQLLFKLRSPGKLLPGLLAFLLLLTISACGNDNSVRVYDNARVLNSPKVQRAASNLPNPVAIYTTNTFQGTQADFQRTAIQKLNGNPNMIVMAIDTNSRYIYIARGSQVPLSRTGINQAVNSFSERFGSGDYTSASIAALNSMQHSINSSGQNRGGVSFSPAVPCLIIPLLLILGALFFAFSRRARMGTMSNRGRLWGGARNPQDNESPFYGPNQGPNRGYGPYDQGYGPPNQRGGMNPWAAGGLGAAAGGLAGYELGKRAGDRGNEQNPQNGDFGGGGGNFGDGGNYGSGGDFGGGGNFATGADQDNAGGGGNFGGGFGGSNFFGSGGTFGNSGGDDFGGGGSFGGGGDFDSGGGFGGGNDDSGGGNF